MDKRHSFSRTPRKALSREARQQMISDMLGEETGKSATPAAAVSEAEAPERATTDPLVDTLDTLDALDSQGLALEDERYDDEEEEIPQDDDAAFEELLAMLDDGEISDVEPEAVLEEKPLEEMQEAPLPLDNFYQATGEAKAVREPQPQAVTEHVPEELEPANAAPLRKSASQEKLRAAYEMAEMPAPYLDTADKWDNLDVMPVDMDHLERNLVITASRNEPAHGAFDVLRTRLVQTLLEHNWKRVAITSPSRNCGKTFTAVNLAISLSRYEATRTILLDFDMRNPSVAGVIGDTQPGKMGDFLRGVIPAEELLVKFDHNTLNIGPSLAIGTNNVVEPYASELAHEPSTAASLERMMQEMSPDIVLFDMPPALAFDDVIAFRKHFDGVLMVVGGGETTPEDVREVMRRMGEDTPLLGVVLNQAEGEDGSDYSYGY
ncbi:CpsD/CapB family tyrosine-protein kinase [Lentibacter sp. XHP0401]|uniref:CpsD/CapB family tyrosine-protein kinase n=1 Tax=Lentibacter sp. XHP0401 TaxID=2984334 RepID=UPI0021E956FA|nr:CpsD/CapB family tyrosine-protein kinase [Lentibacter sp. XHP0401]MCV2893382.1 CpsD/CapB family tyrosine-protein kinase [Lentibacter sp. XHP0401]